MTGLNHCPECGADLNEQVGLCWLCGAENATRGASSEPEVASPHPQPQFGIASLMLTITLIALCLGVLRLAPGVGIALVVLVTPAYARATVFAAREKAAGRRLGMKQKVVALLASLGLVVSLAMAVGAAFYVTCWGGFVGGAFVSEASGASGYDPLVYGMWTGIAVGIIGQIVFTTYFIRWLWRRRTEQRNRLGDVGFILSWVAIAGLYTGVILELTIRQGGELMVLGLLAIPGLIVSLIALRRPKHILASWGVGLGTAACGVFIVIDVANRALLFSTGTTQVAGGVSLFVGLLIAVAISLLLIRWLDRRVDSSSAAD